MAVTYGKSYFSWVQCFHPRIPDPTNISANSNWQMAIGQKPPKAVRP